MDQTDLKQLLKTIRRNFGLLLSLVVIGTISLLILVRSLRQPAQIPFLDPTPTPVISALPATPYPQSTENGKTTVSGLPVIYRVQAGDSLWRISRAVYGSNDQVALIAAANDLQPTSRLEIGQELLLPQLSHLPTEPMQPSAPLAPIEPLFPTPPAASSELSLPSTPDRSDEPTVTEVQPEFYQVQPGDSLWKISEHFYGNGYRWTELYRLNQQSIGTNPDLIYPNTRLRLIDTTATQ